MARLDITAAINEAVSTALTDQALRIGSIMRSPEAEGRREMALTLALNTTLTAASALAILASAPKEHNRRDLFLAAMNAEGRVDLTGDHAPVTKDKKAARMAELKDAANHVAVARGYRQAAK